ncbi:MAG: response regulator transcription factor [Acidimicrobiia bacterium]
MSGCSACGDGSIVDLGLGQVLVAGGDTPRGTAVRAWLAAAGFDVATCHAREVLVATTSDAPDVVVLTADLSQADTVAACQFLRTRSDVPLAVVAPSAKVDPVELLVAGADVVLRSPVGESELVARIRVLLRHRRPRSTAVPETLTHGTITLDRVHGHVQVPDGVLAFDGRELLVLQALLLDAPGLTARRTLRTTLREDDGVIDRLVRSLRERLEAVEGWRRIVTVRGVGFRLLGDRPHDGLAPAPAAPTIDLTEPDVRRIDLRDGVLDDHLATAE